MMSACLVLPRIDAALPEHQECRATSSGLASDNSLVAVKMLRHDVLLAVVHRGELVVQLERRSCRRT